jgi:hypothetical protein
MDIEQRKARARDLLSNPLFQEIMDKMESDAINLGVNAPFTDHEGRQAAMAEVRAVRSFRRNCESILRNNSVPKAAPA